MGPQFNARGEKDSFNNTTGASPIQIPKNWINWFQSISYNFGTGLLGLRKTLGLATHSPFMMWRSPKMNFKNHRSGSLFHGAIMLSCFSFALLDKIRVLLVLVLTSNCQCKGEDFFSITRYQRFTTMSCKPPNKWKSSTARVCRQYQPPHLSTSPRMAVRTYNWFCSFLSAERSHGVRIELGTYWYYSGWLCSKIMLLAASIQPTFPVNSEIQKTRRSILP